VTFAFGTMFFPYATSFYEHNIIAVGPDRIVLFSLSREDGVHVWP